MNEKTDEIRYLIGMNVLMGDAELNRDKKFLCDVLADDLTFRRVSGAIVTKDEYMSELVKAENTYEYLHSENVKAQINEDAALVSLVVRAKGKRGEKEFEGKFRNLRVFILKEDKWQCAVWHNTRLD